MADTAGDVAVPTDTPTPIVTFKKRGAKNKGNIRKRPATPSSQSDDSDYYTSEDESGQRVKRRKKNTGVITASSASNKATAKDHTATVFAADRSGAITSTNDATKQSNWFDEGSKDSLSSKSLLGTTRALSKESQMPDGTYKGLANQASYIQKNPDAPTRSVGPMKAPTNVRTVTVIDYAPDVCKDFKTSGFCGFGDNCKYLHDRSDHKQGWQLDREWETVTKGKKLKGTVIASASRDQAEEGDDDDDYAFLEDIPFVCILCKGPYREPVVTRCGHYFCEPCALAKYRRDPKCEACLSNTNGVFNSAKRLKKLLEKKKERAAKRRQEAIEAGEEVSDEGEEEEEEDKE
jgi:RING finger protein 113A